MFLVLIEKVDLFIYPNYYNTISQWIPREIVRVPLDSVMPQWLPHMLDCLFRVSRRVQKAPKNKRVAADPSFNEVCWKILHPTVVRGRDPTRCNHCHSKHCVYHRSNANSSWVTSKFEQSFLILKYMCKIWCTPSIYMFTMTAISFLSLYGCWKPLRTWCFMALHLGVQRVQHHLCCTSAFEFSTPAAMIALDVADSLQYFSRHSRVKQNFLHWISVLSTYQTRFLSNVLKISNGPSHKL